MEPRAVAAETGAVSFFVAGVPATAGSKRAFIVQPRDPSQRARAIVTDDAGAKGKDWRIRVQYAAREVFRGDPLIGPLALEVEFCLPRPRGHLTATGRCSSQWRPYPAVKPDLTKLTRAVEDALTGILWRDDAQIVSKVEQKGYCDHPGAHVTVRLR